MRSGDETYLRMTKFWGKLFLINFALGVVTGITLEFQFGTNWSRYSAYVGDVFGSLLAIEASVAFFLESTFIGIWIFGWEKLSKKAHATVMWLVAAAGNVSAIWILLANGWMQHPVGFTIRDGRAELTDFLAVITNKFGILEIPPYDTIRFRAGRLFHNGHQRLAPVEKTAHRFFSPVPSISAWWLAWLLPSSWSSPVTCTPFTSPRPSRPNLPPWNPTGKPQTQAPIAIFAIPDEENERNNDRNRQAARCPEPAGTPPTSTPP